MKQRNPDNHPYRKSEKNARLTEERVQQYYGICALLATWEKQPDDVQADNHDYIIKLRAKARNVKNYLLNRNDPTITI